MPRPARPAPLTATQQRRRGPRPQLSRPRRIATFVVATLAVVAAAVRLAAVLAGGPIGMIPGGRLRGEPASGPEPDWSFTADLETIAVEVDPDCPHSVTTWVVEHEGALYVPADFMSPIKVWPYRALEDPRVVVRIDGTLYPRRAVRVTDPDLVAELREAFAAKYDLAPGGLAARTRVWLFRMEPPPPAQP